MSLAMDVYWEMCERIKSLREDLEAQIQRQAVELAAARQRIRALERAAAGHAEAECQQSPETPA